MHVRRSWRALFDYQADAEALARLFHNVPGATEPVVLRPKALRGGSVLCRPGTTDAQVFDDTFVGLYHMPPANAASSTLANLPDDAVILDLGGNVGYTAAHFAALYPGARVICVEMDPGNAAAARANLAQFGLRCEVVQAAVWDRDGEIVYGGTEEWGFRITTLEGETPTPAGDRRSTAPALSMSTLMDRLGLERIDYAKVDVEGAEAAIITAGEEGAEWLRRVGMIKVEHHPPATAESMRAALEQAGFAVGPDPRHPRCVVGVRG